MVLVLLVVTVVVVVVQAVVGFQCFTTRSSATKWGQVNGDGRKSLTSSRGDRKGLFENGNGGTGAGSGGVVTLSKVVVVIVVVAVVVVLWWRCRIL